MSWAGRSTLIKSVAQTNHTYTFSTFDVHAKVYEKLDASSRRLVEPQEREGEVPSMEVMGPFMLLKT